MSEKIKRALGNKEASVFIILIIVMLIATIFNPAFLTFSNIMDVLKGNATLGICSFGMLLIILTGGIDASVCGQLTLVCVVAGKIMANFQFDNIIILYLLGIAIGCFTGMLNGLMVSRLDLPPIIATLGLDSVLMGFLKYYTNGIDIGAKTEIHALLRRLADEGMAVIMVSSELPEILSISDRVLVMRRGRINGEFDGATATQEQIMEKAVMAGNQKGATA